MCSIYGFFRYFSGNTSHLLLFSGAALFQLATPASAIPSPELVIGSVSSLSQVLAVGFAFVSGATALLARKFGVEFSPNSGRVPLRLVLLGLALIAGLGAVNLWQYKAAKTARLERMQATLLRPAQFKGTQIKDESLKETSFTAQENSPLAITTDAVQALLDNPQSNRPILFDVRETGEHAMGSLPGARHVRFPDFMNETKDLRGKQAILFCHNGNRSSETCAELAARGVDCKFIAGGIEKWIVEGRDFSDAKVTSLSDLRALPAYPNKDRLIGSADFTALMDTGDLQIVDTRYPKDFAAGHLPDAINIPVRSLTTKALQSRIAELEKKPTVAACYDRRSCFMAQVLGLDLTQNGIDYQGRYTTPWDYFVPPTPKPHVVAWLAQQNTSLWQKSIHWLAGALVHTSQAVGVVGAVFILAVLSRILILPIALKSERDQMVTRDKAPVLAEIKSRLAQDPTRKARAIQQFSAEHGLTPMRNITALLFLPLMMLGLSATQEAGVRIGQPMGWVTSMGDSDPFYLMPAAFAGLAGLYLHWAVARTRRQAILCWGLGVPLLFAMVVGISFLGNLYLSIALVLLLVQRAYVTGGLKQWAKSSRRMLRNTLVRHLYQGVVPLAYSHALTDAGNKSYRLSVMKNAGLPVPQGVVLNTAVIAQFNRLSPSQKDRFAARIWRMIGKTPCAVRSSAAAEDGADKSFAGVFDSVLHVDRKGLTAALDAVHSAFSAARAGSYSGSDTDHDGNILVQVMVDADYAGVMFTQDSTAPGLMMIELAKGTGDDLVSGRVTPQSLRFGRYTKKPVDAEKPPFDLSYLIKLGDRIEALFNCPQDIEWAYKNGRYYILQSRDITTLHLGDDAAQARLAEWERVFDVFGTSHPDGVILEQDEMSEVLPRPTPASFSLMGQMWAPGGSLDLACRDLGVAYNVPEGKAGHLYTLFGKTYVDRRMKDDMALQLSASKARSLHRLACEASDRFRDRIMPELAEFLAPWKATKFRQMPLDALKPCLSLFRRKLTLEYYVEAERINILAGFAMAEAQSHVSTHPDGLDRLRHSELTHSPMGMLRSVAGLPLKARKKAAMGKLGHRAMFDYELSMPRYCETPDLLWPLLQSLTAPQAPSGPVVADDPVSLALALQDLKEQAKHESLWLVYLIRRVLVAIGKISGLNDLVFHLTLDEIVTLSPENTLPLQDLAIKRKSRAELLKGAGPKASELTLHECEILSAPHLIARAENTGELQGTCVSGAASVTARVFVVDEDTDDLQTAFNGFETGDILVCHMVNPTWLPFVQRSGAVLSEVGGWLSHMSIVAREHNLLMLVACKGITALQRGQQVKVHPNGSISILPIGEPALKRVG